MSDIHLDYSHLFNTLTSGDAFPDFALFAGHSCFYALYRGFAISWASNAYDGFCQHFFTCVGGVIGLFFLFHYRKLNFQLFLLVVFLIISLFCHFSTDMNLILLIPLLLLTLSRAMAGKDVECNLVIFTLALPTLTLNTSPMVHFLEQVHQQYVYFSLKHILIPTQLSMMLYTIYLYKIRNKTAMPAVIEDERLA